MLRATARFVAMRKSERGERPALLRRGALFLDADGIAKAPRGLDDVDAKLLAQSADKHFDRVRVTIEILLIKMFDVSLREMIRPVWCMR